MPKYQCMHPNKPRRVDFAKAIKVCLIKDCEFLKREDTPKRKRC
jgi:hypothetical protein